MERGTQYPGVKQKKFSIENIFRTTINIIVNSIRFKIDSTNKKTRPEKINKIIIKTEIGREIQKMPENARYFFVKKNIEKIIYDDEIMQDVFNIMPNKIDFIWPYIKNIIITEKIYQSSVFSKSKGFAPDRCISLQRFFLLLWKHFPKERNILKDLCNDYIVYDKTVSNFVNCDSPVAEENKIKSA